jgi:hypothetical protein
MAAWQAFVSSGQGLVRGVEVGCNELGPLRLRVVIDVRGRTSPTIPLWDANPSMLYQP